MLKLVGAPKTIEPTNIRYGSVHVTFILPLGTVKLLIDALATYRLAELGIIAITIHDLVGLDHIKSFDDLMVQYYRALQFHLMIKDHTQTEIVRDTTDPRVLTAVGSANWDESSSYLLLLHAIVHNVTCEGLDFEVVAPGEWQVRHSVHSVLDRQHHLYEDGDEP